MVRAIVWKEFREQGLIAVTLLVLGIALLVAVAVLVESPTGSGSRVNIIQYLGPGRLATLLLAVTAGVVCGGALFAAEREAGTMPFLDALPASRGRIWWAKLVAGLTLAVVLIGVIVGAAAALGQVPTVGWAIEVLLYSFQAYAWGAYGSTVARTTLGSVGVAIPSATLAAFVFLFPVVLIFPRAGTNLPRSEGQMIFAILMLFTPVFLSALVYTRPDRDRAADDPTPAKGRPAAAVGDERSEPVEAPAGLRPPRTRLGFRALVWLTTRQMLQPGAIASGFALFVGLSLVLPGGHPILLWPFLALTAGVFAGVTTFADEQSSGSGRYWGERRLPLGRAWAVKLAGHAVFALWLALLLALPAVIRTQVASRSVHGQGVLAVVFRSLLFDQLDVQGWKYVFLPLAYGFAAGHLCGLLFRKLVVAAGVAALVGGMAAAFWMPSLLAGGVTHWQVWLPPLVALLTARLLLRAWTAERLIARGPLRALAVGVAAVVVVQAAGIGYRVVGVPDEPAGEDDVRAVALIPPYDENLMGRDFRTAAERYARVSGMVTDPRAQLANRIDEVLGQGWQRDDQTLSTWVNLLYDKDPPNPVVPDDRPWYAMAAEAADRPGRVGVFLDPRMLGPTTRDPGLENARRMAIALVLRGLQRQAAGDPEAFARNLRTALLLGRTLRARSLVIALTTGQTVAHNTLRGTDRWLEELDGRPDVLRKALDAVAADEPTEPFDPVPHLLAERFVLRETMKAPGQWLPDLITLPRQGKEEVDPEVELIGFAWTVPWERERTRRLVGLGYEGGGRPRQNQLTRGRPGWQAFATVRASPSTMERNDRELRLIRRVAMLRLAVRLYQAERGAVPATLQELVTAGYLPAVPTDPHDGKPFRYRVSAGETLTQRATSRDQPPPGIRIAPGQAVLWSVGANQTDEGGGQKPPAAVSPGTFDDLVYLVPLPPPMK